MSSLEKKAPSSCWAAGLALFSMFFGAGNLIFPLLIGKFAGASVWYAILGLAGTAVLVPLFGLMTAILYQGKLDYFFGRVGRIPGFLILLLLQLVLGPLGVIPRLITLMHATLEPHFSIPMSLFSLLTIGSIFLGNFERKRLISFLGLYLTPILLASMGALIILGLLQDAESIQLSPSAKESFLAGFMGGYNTMDLIAAFLFATLVVPHFQQEASSSSTEKSSLKKMCFSSLIAAGLLLLSYIGLGLLAAHHRGVIDPHALPEQMLSLLAIRILGPIGGLIASIIIIIACFTTAITLSAIFADFLQNKLLRGRINTTTSLFLTLACAGSMANLGFGALSSFLSPLMEIVYPGLILLTAVNFIVKVREGTPASDTVIYARSTLKTDF